MYMTHQGVGRSLEVCICTQGGTRSKCCLFPELSGHQTVTLGLSHPLAKNDDTFPLSWTVLMRYLYRGHLLEHTIRPKGRVGSEDVIFLWRVPPSLFYFCAVIAGYARQNALTKHPVSNVASAAIAQAQWVSRIKCL